MTESERTAEWPPEAQLAFSARQWWWPPELEPQLALYISEHEKHPVRGPAGAFSIDPPWVRAAYGTPTVYALNTPTSFVRHHDKKNLAMIVLGDNQPGFDSKPAPAR